MGGRRLQLFCCDMDLDFIQEFNQSCGLVAPEGKHGKAPPPQDDVGRSLLRQAEHKMMAQNGPPESKLIHRYPRPANEKDNINFSMLAALCTHPDFVRRHLDTTGDFSSKMTALRKDALKVRPNQLGGTRDPYGSAYMLCLLCACGMTLGVKITKEERSAVRKYYTDCGLMRDAVTQLGDALKEGTGYVDGVPWDFDSIAREDSMAAGGAPEEDLLFPGYMTNIWAPDHGRSKGEMEALRASVMNCIARGARPSVDVMATALACMFFDPYATSRTTISSTKADAHPELYRAEAEELVASFANAGSNAPKHDNDVCGACGAEKKADGGALMACSKCRKRHYCSAKCQKEEWKEHKKYCQPPAKLHPAANVLGLRPSK